MLTLQILYLWTQREYALLRKVENKAKGYFPPTYTSKICAVYGFCACEPLEAEV
jgi:hypothetical protein